jgi:BirA family biotin operon repressor/biotin-[acetyl-CoA-carboxylase] ligase
MLVRAMSIHERLLECFLEHPDKFVSGEQLSRQLKCSRTAVWKHIQALRKEGYEFESVPRLGYRLTQKPEKLDLERIGKLLRTKVMGRDIRYFHEVDSTQNAAFQLVEQGAREGTVCIAERQKEGRGRRGRSWHSPLGKGLWMSIILYPQIPLYFTPQLTLLTAVALCRAVRKETGVDAGIKWPNDLLVDGKKISGILLESSAEDERLRFCLAGVGVSVNLAPEDYPPELRDKAISLKMAAGKQIDREKLFAAFMEEFESLYELYHEQGFKPIRIMWEALSVSLNRVIRVSTDEGELQVTAEKIDDMGALHVRLADGRTMKLYSGEITTLE